VNQQGKNNFLIVVAGPTAAGKTAVAISLAKYFKCEIISADSRQFYIEMNAGTAKPDPSQLAEVKHHFINSLHIEQDYSAGAFERDAIHLLDQLFTKNRIVVMAGGSGLYIDAILYGIDDVPKSDAIIRKQLEDLYAEKGITALQQKIKELDIYYYANNDINNTQRLMRAIEVSLISGKPYSSFLKKEIAQRNFKTILIGVSPEREELYNRINKRVDEMLAAGLKEECESLYLKRNLNALQTVGYKELFDFLDGNCSFDEAVNLIKQHTRNYAKRQMTWFRKYDNMQWFKPDAIDEMKRYIDKTIEPDE
jgi:tRNA dimethylallyltransferase